MIKKVRWLLCLIGICMMCSLVGCNMPDKKDPMKYSEMGAFPVIIGNTTLEQTPESIVCLSPEAAQAIIDLGFSARLVGISSDFTPPESFTQLAVMGTQQAPDIQQIVSVAPQLLVTASPISSGNMTILQQAGIKVLVLPTVEQQDNIITEYREILSLLGGNPILP